MKKLVSGLCALALVAGVAAGCTKSSDRLGENPSDRSPSASPPTAPPDNPSGPAGSSKQGSGSYAPMTGGGSGDGSSDTEKGSTGSR